MAPRTVDESVLARVPVEEAVLDSLVQVVGALAAVVSLLPLVSQQPVPPVHSPLPRRCHRRHSPHLLSSASRLQYWWAAPSRMYHRRPTQCLRYLVWAANYPCLALGPYSGEKSSRNSSCWDSASRFATLAHSGSPPDRMHPLPRVNRSSSHPPLPRKMAVPQRWHTFFNAATATEANCLS